MNKIKKRILSYTPLSAYLDKSRHWYLPGFQGISLYDVLQFFREQLRHYSFAERASAISYNFIMAIPPSLLFLFTLVPNLPFVSRNSIKAELHKLIFEIIPAREYNQQVIAFVDSFIDGTKIGLLSFALLFSLFFASNGMMGIMRSFDKGYAGFAKRKGIQMRGAALRLTVLLFALLFTYLALLIMQGAILEMIVERPWLRTLIYYTRWIPIILLVFFAVGLIFRYAPALEKRWRFASPGTFLTTALSLLASLGFSAFVNNFGRYNALYGSIGTMMMIMALIYINSLALLVGFELNVSINALRANAAAADIKVKEELQTKGAAGI